MPNDYPIREYAASQWQRKRQPPLRGVDIVSPAWKHAEVRKRTGRGVAPPLEDLSRGIPSVEDGKTVFHPPAELPKDPNAFLLLGEMNAAPRAVMAAAMQLVLDRQLGSYKVPDGVPIVADGNRVEDQAVANRMPSALNNRFIHIQIEPDLETMVSYALEQQWPIELIQFLRFRPNLLHAMPKVLKDGEAFASPRSWEYLVKSKALDVQDDVVRRHLFVGAVGKGAAIELQGFLSTFRSLPNLDHILTSPGDAPLPAESSAKYAVAGALARKASYSTISAILTYLKRFPEREYAAMAVSTILKTNEGLRNSAELVGWMAKNRAA